MNLANEWRGVSWSIGGDQSYDTLTTLPNILKEFNPQLKGTLTSYSSRDIIIVFPV